MEITASFDVERDASAVFTSLNDLEKVGLCISGVKEVKAISSEESTWKVDIRVGIFSLKTNLTARVTERVPPSKMVFSATGMNIDLLASITLVPTGSGTTVNSLLEIHPSGPLGPAIDLVGASTQKKLVQETIANLKKYLAA